MSNAIAQSATQLTVSTQPEDSFSFQDSVKRAAERNAKGATRERQMLNRNKLVTAVVADFRQHYPAIYGKTDRIPSEKYDKIQSAVDEFIKMHLSQVNPLNAITLRRGFFHNSKEMEITERVNVTGENKLTLKEQHLGVVIFIGQAEKRLKDLQTKPTPDYERENEVKRQIMQLSITKQFIEGEMKHQAELSKETQKP